MLIENFDTACKKMRELRDINDLITDLNIVQVVNVCSEYKCAIAIQPGAKELLLTETITFERKLATKFVLDLLDFYEKMKENLIAEIHSL